MKHLKSFNSYINENKYWGTIGAGILPICPATGRILVGFRSGDVMEPYTWGTFGGKLDIDEGIDESIKEAALREMEEETGYYDHMDLIAAYVFEDKNFEYHNFFGVVSEEFEPQLNWENDKANWFTLDELLVLPKKHFGLSKLLTESLELLKSCLHQGESDTEFKLKEGYGVVSFDFDGVLHTSLIAGTTHPVDYYDINKWKPFDEVFEMIKKESEKYQVVVVTKRDSNMEEELWDYIYKYNLPISEVYCTNNKAKLETLQGIGALRHYDDHPELIKELKDTGIDLILVNPFRKTFKQYNN